MSEGRWVLCETTNGWRCEKCGLMVAKIWKFFERGISRHHVCEECAK